MSSLACSSLMFRPQLALRSSSDGIGANFQVQRRCNSSSAQSADTATRQHGRTTTSSSSRTHSHSKPSGSKAIGSAVETQLLDAARRGDLAGVRQTLAHAQATSQPLSVRAFNAWLKAVFDSVGYSQRDVNAVLLAMDEFRVQPDQATYGLLISRAPSVRALDALVRDVKRPFEVTMFHTIVEALIRLWTTSDARLCGVLAMAVPARGALPATGQLSTQTNPGISGSHGSFSSTNHLLSNSQGGSSNQQQPSLLREQYVKIVTTLVTECVEGFVCLHNNMALSLIDLCLELDQARMARLLLRQFLYRRPDLTHTTVSSLLRKASRCESQKRDAFVFMDGLLDHSMKHMCYLDPEHHRLVLRQALNADSWRKLPKAMARFWNCFPLAGDADTTLLSQCFGRLPFNAQLSTLFKIKPLLSRPTVVANFLAECEQLADFRYMLTIVRQAAPHTPKNAISVLQRACHRSMRKAVVRSLQENPSTTYLAVPVPNVRKLHDMTRDRWVIAHDYVIVGCRTADNSVRALTVEHVRPHSDTGSSSTHKEMKADIEAEEATNGAVQERRPDHVADTASPRNSNLPAYSDGSLLRLVTKVPGLSVGPLRSLEEVAELIRGMHVRYFDQN